MGKGAESRTEGNFVAIGTMNPEIEIWDLDIIDTMYPNAILGQVPEEQPQMNQNGDSYSQSKKKSKRRRRKLKANDEYHVDAVLALAANRHHRSLLASASADNTVKLWDLTTGKCAKSYSMHTSKVRALDWHPTESTVLLSGKLRSNCDRYKHASTTCRSTEMGCRGRRRKSAMGHIRSRISSTLPQKPALCITSTLELYRRLTISQASRSGLYKLTTGQ